MYSSLFALASLAIRLVGAHPFMVHPTPLDQVDASTFIITDEDTVNGTTPSKNIHKANVEASSTLPIKVVNNLGSNNVKAYITGRDPNEQVFLLKNDGSAYYPPNPPDGSPPQEITQPIAFSLGPKGSTTLINLNYYLQDSGRIWIADGDLHFFVNHGGAGPSLVEPSAVNPSDPNAAVSWGFAELVFQSGGHTFADISYVDFVGLPIGIRLDTNSGAIQEAKGLPGDAVSKICGDLTSQAALDGQPWNNLCTVDTNHNLVRVLSPNLYISNVHSAFSNYWSDYVTQVYNHFKTNDLTINAGGTFGDQIGRVDGSGTLVFPSGDSYAPPTYADIFGCSSGSLANAGSDLHKNIAARICAAFNRATYFVNGGNQQPNGVTDYSKFYNSSPCNHYSRIVHSYEVDGKGYAFSYDDVHPAGGSDLAGTVDSYDAASLTYTVGGPS